MKRLLLVAHADRPRAADAMAELRAWLAERAEVVGAVTDTASDLAAFDAEAVITFGGDGTILDVVRRLGESQVPVLGINLGRLGYLAEFGPEETTDGVEKLLAGELEIAERMMLRCEVRLPAAGRTEVAHGLNEVLVGSATGNLSSLDLAVDGRPLACFHGDGVLAATPTGSTAYSLSAGGPILAPSLRSLVITPVSAHELALRPLVITAREALTVSVAEARTPVRVVVDGREISRLDDDATVTVRAADRVFRLAQRPDLGRYEILRQKLGWGGRENACGPGPAGA